MAAAVTEDRVEGHPVRVLAAAGGELESAWAVQVGMIGCSLKHRGEELLGQRGGLAKYAETGSSMGIPLLHPWANRLSRPAYRAAGREVVLDWDTSPLRPDPNGLPIHGLLSGCRHWELVEAGADGDAARLVARLDFGAHPELMAGFPYPHELRQEVVLSDGGLSVSLALRPTTDQEVPVSFGYHPYLTLPAPTRQEWEVTLPVRRRMVLDEQGIPTGASEPVQWTSGTLDEREFDDLFDELDDPPEFTLAGGGRRLSLRFDEGYPFAQVYAPADQELICFEPMTAPTNALVSGARLRTVSPGADYVARFSIAVS